MTLLDPQRTEREEREMRRAGRLLLLTMLVVVGACGFFLYTIIVPGRTLHLVGSIGDFALDQPADRAVPKLSMSSFIELRPNVSQDVVFVTREAAGWTAVLGLDIRSGCFISWNAAGQVYQDACTGRSYDRAGRNLSGDVNELDLVRLPVEVRDGQVYVEDRICREGEACR
jgi:hypothetical protein